MERNELLLAITRCPELGKARNDAYHPCRRVVCFQGPDDYHVPEPWQGHIETAPILFISLNPGYDIREVFPTPSWNDADTKDFFIRRFAADAKWTSQPTDKEIRLLVKNANGNEGYYKPADMFCGWVRERAEELLQHRPVPGKDYSMTSAVHCKSKKWNSTDVTVRHCTNLWLQAIMELSVARVVVTISDPTWNACADAWGLQSGRLVQFDVPIVGSQRAVLRLPHPRSGRTSKIERLLDADDLEHLRQLVRQP